MDSPLPTRKQMTTLRIACALILLLVLQACSNDRPPPNIIHIMADDLGYGELGSYGQKMIKTPHLDDLAAQGMRFTQYYAGNALCNPSRYAFMTGKHAGSTGVITNGNNTLATNTLTVGRMLQGAGYYTGLVGKWALGSETSTGAPLKQGFDYSFGYPNQVAAHNYYPEFLFENGAKIRLGKNKVSKIKNISAIKEVYAADVIHQRAMAFIGNNKNRPFYLQLDYNLPHVNNELQKKTGNGFEHPGPGRYAQESWTAAEKSYAEMVSLVDDYVGALIGRLRGLGIAGNTLVIFTSDNGPTGVRGLQALQRFGATGGLKGMKGMLFEGGIRVPMIAWWPGVITPHSVNHTVSAFWDVLPTLAELSGSQQISGIDGVSFAGTLKGDKGVSEDRILYWEIYGRKAVRQGDWKWVYHPMKETDFLFNIAEDPEERVNLASSSAEVLARLRSISAKTMRTMRFGEAFTTGFVSALPSLERGVELTLQSSGGPAKRSGVTAGAGAGAGMPPLPRGLNLLGLQADGKLVQVAGFDLCASAISGQDKTLNEIIQMEQRRFVAYTLLVKDSAVCENRSLELIFSNLPLERWREVGLRIPYIAVLPTGDYPAAEFIGEKNTSIQVDIKNSL